MEPIVTLMIAPKSNPLIYNPFPMHIRNLHNWTWHSSRTWDARQSRVAQVQSSETCSVSAACSGWLTNPLAFWWSGNNAEPAIGVRHTCVTFVIKTFSPQWLLSQFGQMLQLRISFIKKESSSLLVPVFAHQLPRLFLVSFKNICVQAQSWNQHTSVTALLCALSKFIHR